MMNAVTIPVIVGEDRQLVVDLPATIPVGPADIVIVPRKGSVSHTDNPARRAARAKLDAAGILATDLEVPEGAIDLSDEDIERLGQLAPGARPSLELINEDRGLY